MQYRYLIFFLQNSYLYSIRLYDNTMTVTEKLFKKQKLNASNFVFMKLR
jgi:hypothetical protein